MVLGGEVLFDEGDEGDASDAVFFAEAGSLFFVGGAPDSGEVCPLQCPVAAGVEEGAAVADADGFLSFGDGEGSGFSAGEPGFDVSAGAGLGAVEVGVGDLGLVVGWGWHGVLSGRVGGCVVRGVWLGARGGDGSAAVAAVT